MPSSRRVVCLNLGMQTVSLGDFQIAANGGLTLLGCQTAELIADPAADAIRGEQLKGAISELCGKSKQKKPRANYVLPSQAVFTRFVKLPEVPAEQIDQLIGFEAQQNVPFPIDEVVWDYQILGEPSDGKLDIVLVAIKASQVTEVTDAVESGGVRSGIIDVSSMALYNAFRYNYSDQTGCSVLIDIGARTTNLVFIEGSHAFSRSIPIGGSTITAAIAKEFGKEFGASEEIKRSKGFVGLGGAYAEPEDPLVSKLSKLIRNTMTRLHAEIARSISFYRANQGGSQPLRAYLAGGCASLGYMREFFSEKLQMPIEYFNPLRNVLIGPNVDTELLSQKAHMFGELVGAALREEGNCPVELSLRPPSLIKKQDVTKRAPALVAACIAILAALGGWYAYLQNSSKILQSQTDAVSSEVTRLKGLATKFDRISAEQKRLEELIAPLLLVVNERAVWAAIIDELNTRLPKRFVWVTKLTPLSGGKPVALGDAKAGDALRRPEIATPPRPGQAPPAAPQIDAIEVQGLYLENEKRTQVVSDFVHNLVGSSVFAIADKKESAKHVQVLKQPDGETWAYSFVLQLPLKNPISIP